MDGVGREVLLLLALCHDHHHRHCRRHVENVPLFVLLLLPIVSVLYSVCVRVYAADGRSLGPSDCRLVCRWCAVMESSSFGRLLWGERACVPVCVRANRNRRWPLMMMMMMIVCLMRCALVRTFSLSVCFSVIAVILLTDTWLLDNRIFAS